MKRFKAKYISDVHSIFLKKGEIYEVYYPLDDPGKKWLAFYLEDFDEPETMPFPRIALKL